MGFDEWFKKRHLKTGLYEKVLFGDDDALYLKHEMKKSHQFGAQSRQAEIDELQKRIDKTLIILSDPTFGHYQSIAQVIMAIKHLKGETNEN